MSVKRVETGACADQVVAGGGFGDRPASPLPPLFWLLAKLAELWPTEACLPAGRGAGNSRRKSATKERRREIRALQAPTEEGLDRPERTRTIRQDSSQNRKTLLQPERSEALFSV
uniref:Uncharacterized protein n=1 Tax=Arthrobacter sp. Chr15 TaxID=447032 RepID=A6YFS1_9MICC|nr:unknown [Arthrobacter sp. Chr15]